MIRAPRSEAQRMPLAIDAYVPEPELLSTLIGISGDERAIPAMPSPLPVLAAAMLAT